MLIAVAICAALYGLVVVGLYAGQRRILFPRDAAEVDPATLGLKAEILRLKTEDGESLLAWRIPPAPGRPMILYFHGNSGGIDLRFERFRALAQGGHGALGDRVSRLRQLNRFSQRARAQARRRSSLCGGDRERRRARAHRPPRGVAGVRGRGRAGRAPHSWRARARTRPIRRSPTSRRPHTGSCPYAHCSATRSATTC